MLYALEILHNFCFSYLTISLVSWSLKVSHFNWMNITILCLNDIIPVSSSLDSQIIYCLVIFCILNDLWNGFEFLKSLWSKLITHLYSVPDVDLSFFPYRCISLTGRHTMTCADFILVITYSSWEGRIKKSLLWSFSALEARHVHVSFRAGLITLY